MSLPTVYVVSESRTNSDNAITKNYGSFFMACEIDRETGLIVDFGCTHVLDLTEKFLKKIFVGKNIVKDFDSMKSDIQESYCGSSSRAIQVALGDIQRRYLAATKK